MQSFSSNLLYRMAQEHMRQLQHEAELARLASLAKPTFKVRVAHVLEAWAKRLDPELHCQRGMAQRLPGYGRWVQRREVRWLADTRRH